MGDGFESLTEVERTSNAVLLPGEPVVLLWKAALAATTILSSDLEVMMPFVYHSCYKSMICESIHSGKKCVREWICRTKL